MPELDVSDVESFSGGRLSASDPEVERMLNAALRAARRYCGWPVNPVVTGDTVVIDGPGSRILNLPTRKVVELTSLTEDDVVVDLSTVRWSAGGPPGILERPVSVRKKSNGWWTCYYQGVEVVMTHGYDDDEAADWRYAVLSMVDQMGQVLFAGRGELDMVSKKVDDVTYRWADPYAAAAESALHSGSSIFEGYCLPRVEFL
jgi:hypothetical protein